MGKLSRKTWLVLAVLVAGVILARLMVLPEEFPRGNELVTYSNYLKLDPHPGFWAEEVEETVFPDGSLRVAYVSPKRQKEMSVKEVEAIFGPADQIVVDPNRPGQETRVYVGPRDRLGQRARVAVHFRHGQMFFHATTYKNEQAPSLLTRTKGQLEGWWQWLRR
jgi:hypothetical protein